jgi:2-polyprenyl-3-methyl-5-hydroxy-6-metoxy-1,4-benzoquinol methylase
MKDQYRRFYECVGQCYPEDEIAYSTLSGILRKKWVLSKMPKMPRGNLLDCGCNVGRLSSQWKRGTVYGIDIAFSVLKRGKKLYHDSHFIQGDLRAIDFIKTDSIDNAIAIEVLEHLEKPYDFLNGLHKIMKVGGFVLITVPCYTYSRPKHISLGIMKSFGVLEGTDGQQYLHTAYKPEELVQMTTRCGFKVIEKGFFEFELRGWLKPLSVVVGVFELISEKFFPYSRLNYMVARLTEHVKINLFYIFDTFCLSKLLKSIFKEGKRSYVLVQK